MHVSTNTIAENPETVGLKIDLEAIIKSRLPPLPGSVTRILHLLQDPNVSTRTLAESVGYDPLLTLRILRLANSPMYYLQRKVRSIENAIDVIGVRTLYDIVMVGVASEAFAKEIKDSAIGRIVWEHSLTVALIARELSRKLGMRGSDEVFLCGLLHDIGKIMLLCADADQYAPVLEKSTESELLEWEVKLFGYDHAVVGSVVAQAWKLPDEVCRVIFNHHLVNSDENFSMVSHVVNVANIVANVNGYGLRLDAAENLFNSKSMMLLKIKPAQIDEIWNEIEENLQEVINVLTHSKP